MISTITSDVSVLFRFIVVVAIFFLAGRLAGPKSVTVEEKEEPKDVIEEFLKKVSLSGSSLDAVNLILLQEAFNLVNNFVTIIETSEILDKEKYFPKPAIEKFKTLVADVQMKIDELRKRFNVDENDRNRIKELIDGVALDYCQNVTGVSTVSKTKAEEPEDVRKATEREFDELFEEEERKLDNEEFLKQIADIVESHGI